jgi:hypothetical protein
MASIKVICAACLKDVRECRCPDEAEQESFGFTINRAGEEFMRWLRYWRFIK